MTPNLTRSGFFAAIAAALSAVLARAQTIITPCRPKLVWGDQKQALCNGQCPNPECDYMAPPLPPTLTMDMMPEQSKLGMIVWDASSPWDVVYRINRCPKCTTAYWQLPSPPETSPK